MAMAADAAPTINSGKDDEEQEQTQQKIDGNDLLRKIQDGVSARATYIKDEAESLTMNNFRRLLEKDLGLESLELDVHKKTIKDLVDKILNEPSAQKMPDEAMLTSSSQEPLKENESDQSVSPVKVTKKKRKNAKIVEEDDDNEKSSSPQRKQPKKRKNTKIVEEDDENEKSSSPQRKQPKKKASKAPEVKAAPVQSKLIDQLKQMIKSAGMNIPPSCYKRVKQLPERERENGLVKELESILKREGLNRHSSEKDIKAVKKTKDKQKDLEGIDVGNILTKGRGRRQAAIDFYKVEKSDESDSKSDVQEDDF